LADAERMTTAPRTTMPAVPLCRLTPVADTCPITAWMQRRLGPPRTRTGVWRTRRGRPLWIRRFVVDRAFGDGRVCARRERARLAPRLHRAGASAPSRAAAQSTSGAARAHLARPREPSGRAVAAWPRARGPRLRVRRSASAWLKRAPLPSQH